jgi:cation diffusion facilitator family transporter
VNQSEQAERLQAESVKSKVALTSVVAAVFLTAVKLAVGLLTGSLGILAEALHSGLDLGAAAMTYGAVRIADRPPDEDHPYGHGKVESFSALFETLLLVVTSGWIIYEAVLRLKRGPGHVDPNAWGFVVMAGSIVIDWGRSRALMAAAKKYHSQALEADALHFSTDIWSSAVVIVGLVLVRIGGPASPLAKADAIAALGVAVIVLWVSVRLGKATIDVLLDRAPEGLAEKVTETARSVGGILDCRRVRVRHVGPITFIDLVVDVARSIPLEQAHAIASGVEQRLRSIVARADVVVHVEPAAPPGESLLEQVQAIAGTQGLYVHDVHVTHDGHSSTLDMHLEVASDLSLADAHALADRLEATLVSKLDGVSRVNTHIEPRVTQLLPGVAAPDRVVAVMECLQGLAITIPELAGFHDVNVHRTRERRLYVALHCLFDGSLSIGEVHRLSTRIEDRMKVALPEIQNVHVHVEPIEGPRASLPDA